MKAVNLTSAQFAQFRELADREMAAPGRPTRIWEDFPLILAQDNLVWVLGIVLEDQVVAGLACLVRQFRTSCGTVPVAGIGHVVTRPEHRGKGCSRLLQEAMLDRLRGVNVPLAVLWTDQPDIFRGRGFVPAGWEFHADLANLSATAPCPTGFSVRAFRPEDSELMAGLYDRHPYRTLRHPGDSRRLYTIPGTRGLVATGEDDTVVAGVFCGKGSDFPDFAAEWAGPHGLLIPLLDEVRKRGWARHVLLPAGCEKLAEALAQRGAAVTALHSGYWSVLQPEQLSRYLQGAGVGSPGDITDPVSLLGTVDSEGVVMPGPLTVAVWGFDSV
jgi:GNAT superfamily N-acetyltransferase